MLRNRDIMRWSRVVIAIVAVMMMCSCHSSRNIAVKDSSTLVASKKEFFENLNASMVVKDEGVRTYYSKKMSIAAEGIPVYNSLNAQMYIEGEKKLLSKVYLPFPVVEVARIKIENGKLALTSKMIDTGEPINCPDVVIGLLRSALLGCVPNVYSLFGEKDFSKFDIYIENNRYIMSRSVGKTEVRLTVNGDYTLASAYAKMNESVLNLECDKYTLTDGYNIPMKIELKSRIENKDLNAELSIKSASLNGNTKLDF